MGTAAMFPLIDRRQEHACGDARCARYVDRPPHFILHVGNKILLMHGVTGAIGDARVQRLQQQRTATARQSAWGCIHALHHVRMPSLNPLEPATILRLADGHVLLLVDIFRALGIVGGVSPFGILEVIANVGQLGPGAWQGRGPRLGL